MDPSGAGSSAAPTTVRRLPASAAQVHVVTLFTGATVYALGCDLVR